MIAIFHLQGKIHGGVGTAVFLLHIHVFAIAAAELQAVVKASRLQLAKQMARHRALIQNLLA